MSIFDYSEADNNENMDCIDTANDDLDEESSSIYPSRFIYIFIFYKVE